MQSQIIFSSNAALSAALVKDPFKSPLFWVQLPVLFETATDILCTECGRGSSVCGGEAVCDHIIKDCVIMHVHEGAELR